MRVLFAWEFGSGLGHLARLKPFVDASLKAGYEVALVAKELERVRSVFDTRSLRVFKAPHFVDNPLRQEQLSWVEYLLVRYQSPARLVPFILAWNSVFDAVQPDVVVHDASPTALLSSFGRSWAKWTVGSPFFMPRTDIPFLGLFPGGRPLSEVASRLRRSERRLLSIVRDSFEEVGMPAVSSLNDGLLSVDRELLTTIPQFDYFGPRSTGEYLGMPASSSSGQSISVWPERSRLKVFAYVKFSKKADLDRFLSGLEAVGLAAVVYAPNYAPAAASGSSAHVFLSQPALMDQVCAEADLVIHMGGSQTVARCLKSGIPQLVLVPAMEQRLTAAAAQKLGAVVACSVNSPSYDDAIKRAAGKAGQGRFDPPDVNPLLLDGSFYEMRIEQLVSGLMLQ